MNGIGKLKKWITVELFVVFVLQCQAEYTDDQLFQQASHKFGDALYKKLAPLSNGSIVFSPFSIQLLLTEAMMGAAGDTKDEMYKGLCYQDIENETTITNNYEEIMDSVSNDSTLKIGEFPLKENEGYLIEMTSSTVSSLKPTGST